MTQETIYHIGTPGTPWGVEEKAQWLAEQSKKRSYFDDVVSKIETFKANFDVEQYGELAYESDTYPLFVVRTKNWDAGKPTVLVTGGVHGYETSGVHGALRFIETKANEYQTDFNVVVAPCLSPWGYETINRWNPAAIDPNRSFVADSPAGECANIMNYIAGLGVDILAHIDLHETTDTDNSEFRPAKAAMDGKLNTNWNIPDGFYLVGNSEKPYPDFQKAVLDSVEKVTHIADADEENKLIGEDIAHRGLILLPTAKMGLCISFSKAEYATTTEVYPDSPKATPEQCIEAQVAAVTGGLDFLK